MVARIGCAVVAIILLMIAWMFFDFWWLYNFDRPTVYFAAFTFVMALPFAVLAWRWR